MFSSGDKTWQLHAFLKKEKKKSHNSIPVLLSGEVIGTNMLNAYYSYIVQS